MERNLTTINPEDIADHFDPAPKLTLKIPINNPSQSKNSQKKTNQKKKPVNKKDSKTKSKPGKTQQRKRKSKKEESNAEIIKKLKQVGGKLYIIYFPVFSQE